MSSPVRRHHPRPSHATATCVHCFASPALRPSSHALPYLNGLRSSTSNPDVYYLTAHDASPSEDPEKHYADQAHLCPKHNVLKPKRNVIVMPSLAHTGISLASDQSDRTEWRADLHALTNDLHRTWTPASIVWSEDALRVGFFKDAAQVKPSVHSVLLQGLKQTTPTETPTPCVSLSSPYRPKHL
ncbi:hypothetical protein SPRG_13012 [Saprolegnia parasitica CBS 223.65]|uniref:Uncharacterized protein n=1 Tax=Saprolegnia parasitica (strain CBS 223.65) TaxID=695850 RepID=A0A067BT75_SAPPC|nr:hypothetical protein SPRG_13012 [Saprolegnia parasitica CBS 223.65]KDO21674.1 hypothetical protein SPRG_13012 [Saprolegnia parasitica CBS 223.65]|eukprot:XP_012207598.1 hypothetical protein SPRG_13012 [Saprolegnia parasitica CBS 223.65]